MPSDEMSRFFTFLFIALLPTFSYGQEGASEKVRRVQSRIDTSESPELVLIQEFTVRSPIEEVWKAYTTKKGYESWAVPKAEFDFRVGGTIQTNYNPEGYIGDSTTILTHVINYVPRKMITLQAEITENFPEFMKEEAKNFFNVIYFQDLNGMTKVESYGIGYKNNDKYLRLLNFFIPANEQTLRKLIELLETEESNE
jgi:uncharacterized protein YndB with AHSA1/START domain